MHGRFTKTAAYSLLLLFITSEPCTALQIKTRYATIIYNNEIDLHRFNEEFYLGKYGYLLRKDAIGSVSDEIRFKTDLIVERVKSILDMFPENLEFRIVICSSGMEIEKVHKVIYGKETKYSAFYSPEINTIFFSVDDMELSTVAHEFAHVIMTNYFTISPPVKIHELLSRYAAKHIKD
jgi:hypothetical protein